MKTSKKNFVVFKKEFLRWVDILGLKQWKIFFLQDKLDNAFGECRANLSGGVATIVMTLEIDDRKHFNPKENGKHEALELLLVPLDVNAKYRYVSESEINEARHAIIRVLEKVLK